MNFKLEEALTFIHLYRFSIYQLCLGKPRRSISPGWTNIAGLIFQILSKNPNYLSLLKHFKFIVIPKYVKIVKIIIVDFKTIAEPLSEELPSHEKLAILEKSSLMLKKVKTYIDKK